MERNLIIHQFTRGARVIALCAALAIPTFTFAAEDGKPREGGDRPDAKRDGDKPRDGADRPDAKRDGDKPRDGADRPDAKRDGADRPDAKRDGGDRPDAKRNGDKPRDGADRPDAKRDGDKPREIDKVRDGDKPRDPAKPRDQERPDQDKKGDGPKGFDKLRMGPNGEPMRADRTKSAEARRALDEAKAQLSEALSSTSGMSVFALENELGNQEEYRQAVLALRRTQADYDAVRRPIFDALRLDSYYRELERKKTNNDRVIHSLIVTGRGSFDYLFPHAMAAMEVRKRMSREEIVAMAQSPEVEDARQRMLRASAKVRAIRNGHISQTNNPEALRLAKADAEAARERVRKAQAAYSAALADEAEYDKLRAEYIAELRRTGRAPGN